MIWQLTFRIEFDPSVGILDHDCMSEVYKQKMYMRFSGSIRNFRRKFENYWTEWSKCHYAGSNTSFGTRLAYLSRASLFDLYEKLPIPDWPEKEMIYANAAELFNWRI